MWNLASRYAAAAAVPAMAAVAATVAVVSYLVSEGWRDKCIQAMLI
jgi:hypothetical protein